ncbi:MAG TPA: hypothetical protein VMU60_06920 [Syntrophobacteria bacterium]|nr:hypothetical protein [Syntrophobacteria bacterium]
MSFGILGWRGATIVTRANDTWGVNQGFNPGFRLSALDAVVLVVGVIVAFALIMVAWCAGFVVGFVLGHFFLFCHVLRVSRALELAWAGIFATFAAATLTLDAPGWPVTVSVSLIATWIVAAVEMRKPSYHGVGWQSINPGLLGWWKACHRERPDGSQGH